MAVLVTRPVQDIEQEIRDFIRSYDPLKQARDFIDVHVDEMGRVKVVGHVRSVQAHRVLVDNLPDIAGVTECDFSEFYSDEEMRLEIGRLLSRGVVSRVNFGIVVLVGEQNEELAEQIVQIPGIRKVIFQS